MDGTVRFEQDGLAITAHKSTRKALIIWEGVSDAREPGLFLNNVIEQLSTGLVELEVTVDLRPLSYINSATVSPLINLIRSLDQSNSAVDVVFSTAEWQQTHCRCLGVIARTLKNVKVRAEAARPSSVTTRPPRGEGL